MTGGKLKDEEILDGLSLWYLKTSGLWGIFNHYRETGVRNRLFHVWFVGMFIGFTPMFIVSVAGPFFIEKDLEGLTLVALNPMTVIQGTVKMTVAWVYIKKQTQLLDLMKKDFLTCVPEDKKDGVSQILGKAVIEANAYAWLGAFMNMSTVMFWNVLPVLRSEFVRNTLGISIFGTPVGPNKILGFWYPVDCTKSPASEIIYVYEFCTCVWTGFIITLIECLVAQTVVLFTGYLNAFKYLVENFKTSRDAKLDRKRLLVYVKEHERLMKVGDDIRGVYSFAVTVELATGLLILIIGVFNFIMNYTKKMVVKGSGKGDVAMMVKFIIYSLYILVEISIYCFTGDNLETTSADVCFAAYSCEWYEMDIECRKTLLMMMVRSRNPVVMKAGRVYPVNHTALANILQMTYSASMVLYRAKVPESA